MIIRKNETCAGEGDDTLMTSSGSMTTRGSAVAVVIPGSDQGWQSISAHDHKVIT